MRIGLFGDSFCAMVESNDPTYQTYIKKLIVEYNATITNTGIPGSSVGDIVMMQLPKSHFLPDVCIFVWTDSPRLFNREIRNINHASAECRTNTGQIWSAASSYYKYLYDSQFTTLQFKALLEYIDTHILTTFPKSTKIIHLWSYGEQDKTYIHNWKNGVEIRPALINVSDGNTAFPNHLAGELKNTLVFDWIKEAIDNYASGTLLTKEINYEQH